MRVNKYVGLLLVAILFGSCHSKLDPFNSDGGGESLLYVYHDSGSPQNNVNSVYPPNGTTPHISFDYTSNSPGELGGTDTAIHVYFWPGLNNWPGYLINSNGFDLRSYRKLKFKARGQNGGESVSFGMGGLSTPTIQPADSGVSSVAFKTLTTNWQNYEIDLSNVDLSHISGLFFVTIDPSLYPSGGQIYIDEILYSPS